MGCGWMKQCFEKIRKRGRNRAAVCIFTVCLLLFSIFAPALTNFSIRNVTKVQAAETAETLNPSVDTVLSSVHSYMLSVDTNPDFNSIWNVIGLTRSGLSVPASYIQTFYQNVYAYLVEKNWVLTRTKYTDYSKLIVGLTAIGKDAQNIGGHNLLAYLSDFTDVKRQGFNGPIWALIALNSHPSYTIPADAGAQEQTTEEGLITYLLSRETASGGWTLSGTEPDADITGMTIQALSPYYGMRDDVTEAIDRALAWLSESQLESGGYSTMGTETSESVAQIIVALCSVGIDCAKDSRFIKNGKWPMTGLFQYYLPQGGFMHVAAGAANNGGGEAGTLNGMATEQGMYATVAYKRLLDGKTALYDMSDVTLSAGEVVDVSAVNTENDETATGSAGSDSSSGVKIKISNVRLDYSQITVEVGKTRRLKVTVTPDSASNKNLKWSSSNKKVATVNQKGKVKGVKAGTAKIKVKTKDGSGKKAVCTVKVVEVSSSSESSSGGGSSRSSGSSSGTTGNSSSGASTGGSASGTTAAGTTAAAAAQTSSTAGQTGQTTGSAQQAADGTTEAGGWSFDGAAYVPESSVSADYGDNASGMAEDNGTGGSAGNGTITIEIPVEVAYTLSGAVGLGALESLLWLLKKKGVPGLLLGLLHRR